MGIFDIFKKKTAEISPAAPFVKPIFRSYSVGENVVAGEVYVPKKPNGKGIIYCHGGFADALTPDAGAWSNPGYTVLHIDFENEGNIALSDPDRDVQEVIDAVEFFRDLYMITSVSLIGVSRGGYVALKAFGTKPDIFKKVVNFMGPINMHDPDNPYDWGVWKSGRKSAQQIKDAKAYFDKSKDPVEMAKEGAYDGLRDKILCVYGVLDKICPYKSMMLPFNSLTRCWIYLVNYAGHNVHRTVKGQKAAYYFLEKEVVA